MFPISYSYLKLEAKEIQERTMSLLMEQYYRDLRSARGIATLAQPQPTSVPILPTSANFQSHFQDNGV